MLPKPAIDIIVLKLCDFAFSAGAEWLRWLSPCGARVQRVLFNKINLLSGH